MKNFKRLELLRAVVCLAFVVGILFSYELWFPVARSFPRIPLLIALPENIVFTVERLLAVLLAVSLISLSFVRRPKIFFFAAIASLVSLIFFDQTRLQPWVYQYLLLLGILALHDWRSENESNSAETLGLLQIIIAALYIWSGAQKLNFSFFSETLPLLTAPLQNVFPKIQLPFGLLGLSIALVEILIGCGLLVRRTRNFSVGAAALTHAVILGLLMAKDFNRIVWIWNAWLVVIVAAAFRGSAVSIKQPFALRHSDDWKTNAAKLIVAAAVLLPALSFFGWWDLYLSGALYSGNTPVAVVRINEVVFEKLPLKARQSVFHTNNGEPILPLFEWAMADLSVPAYPEPRVFRQAARRVCELTENKHSVELIIKERPAIFDGRYQVTRIDCARLETAPR